MGEKKYRSFEDARKFMRQLGIHGVQEWKNFVNSGTMPVDIPERPEYVYKRNWDGWSDFLGNDEDKAWETMEKLRKTTDDLSNYKKALAQYDWANMQLSDKAPKTRFSQKTGSVKTVQSTPKDREQLAKRIQSSITKLEQISEKLTKEPGSSPKNPILARKKLTSKDIQKLNDKIENLRDANDWAGVYAITKDVISKPTTSSGQRIFEVDEAMIHADHIESMIELGKAKEALAYGKRLLRAAGDDEDVLGLAWFILGEIYQKLKRHNEAISAFTSAIDIGDATGMNVEGDGNSWYNLAGSHAQAGNFRQACYALIVALARDSDRGKMLLEVSDDPDFFPLKGYPQFDEIISNTARNMF